MRQKKVVTGLSIFGLLFCCCLFLFGSAKNVKLSSGWNLKGNEILLELCGENPKFPHGIYALDPSLPNPKPRLLLKGGRRPVWSPKRRFIAYIEGINLRISDRNGNATWMWMHYLSNLNFHDPPVIWTWKEGFFVIWRLAAWGGTVAYAVEFPPQGGEEWQPFFPLIIMPLKRRLPKEPLPTQGDIQWSDLLCFNNPSASPDGRFVAAEVYPSGPEDLRRAESKILIYERCPPEEMELWWQWQGQTFRGQGRRLTNLGKDVTELRPLWSPTGEWIAFTAVHWNEGYVAPTVIRPDGNDYTELLSEHAPYASISLGSKWEPVVPLDVKDDVKNKVRLPSVSAPIWGQPHVYPTEWSEDGKFLLLNMGEKRYQNLQVARWDEGKWWVIGVGGHMGSGFCGIKFATWGPENSLAIVTDFGIEIWIIKVRFPDTDWEQKLILMPDKVWIEWMDW